MSDPSPPELGFEQASKLQGALRHRAAGVSPAGASVRDIHLLVARRRRRRAAGTLAVASIAVLGGLAFSNRGGTDEPTPASADRPPRATAATTVPVDSAPPLDAIPLPTIGAYPRDPALGAQPTKVTYTVIEGDTFETIAAKLGMDPATVKTQTGGEIKVGEVISLLVGPSVAARAEAVAPSTSSSTTIP